MPILSKPTSDEDRLNLLKTSINTGNSDALSDKTWLNSETISRATVLVENFDSKLKAFAGTLALRSKEIREKNDAKKALEGFIRDMWETVKRRVYRNHEPAETLTYYTLPLDGTVPDTITGKEIFILAGQIIEGDKKATAAGYPPAVNPSAEELDTALKAAEKEYNEVAPADRQYDEAQEALNPLRTESDELIDDIIAELEFNLRKKDAASRRRIMRTYGVTFIYAKGEPREDDTTGEPAA